LLQENQKLLPAVEEWFERKGKRRAKSCELRETDAKKAERMELLIVKG